MLHRVGFRFRVTLVLVGLVVLALGSTLPLVNRQNLVNATVNIEESLAVTKDVFQQLLSTRSESLRDIVRPATRDHAFRATYATGDKLTIESAMRNLMGRINQIPTDFMVILDFDRNVIAEAMLIDASLSPADTAWLIQHAAQTEYFESEGVVLLDNKPHQVVVMPLLLPDPVAWIVIGFPIDQSFLDVTASITRKNVSIIIGEGDASQIYLSELDPPLRNALLTHYNAAERTQLTQTRMASDNNELLAQFVPLHTPDGTQVVVALHDSLSEALAPYKQLNQTLWFIFGITLMLSLVAAVFIGQSVSSPLRSLTLSVRSIADGNYAQRVSVRSSDEVGELANAYNAMARGLQERELVRNLLGKVVSEEIAHELLNGDVELGGEERKLTIMFCDIRNFTSLCENTPPSEILDLLNAFFGRATYAVERYRGVVDKYMGDAIMALFGAPVSYDGEAESAMKAARDIQQELDRFNTSRQGDPISIGIGIGTGMGVVGNMGSPKRLNYTVVGDCVNMASRLESLTRFYQVSALVTQQTTLDAPHWPYRLVDKVIVKGRTAPETIYEPLFGEYDHAQLARYHAAVRQYFARDWARALSGFEALTHSTYHDRLTDIYAERCKAMLASPPPSDWDGVFAHANK